MRLFGLLFFIFFFGFLTISHAQNGSAGQPFTSLGQAQNVAADGVYYFSLPGASFSTYVRVGGWVQVAIDFRPGIGNLPQSTALNNTVRGILTPTALSTLGSATVTRLLTSNGQLDVQNTRPGIITRIVNNQTLLAVPADNTDNGANWTGTNTLATQFTNFGNTTAYGLHSNFFHAGNNGDGIHWIPFFNMQQIKNSAGDLPTGAYFQLLVRAPMVAVVMGPTINTQPSTTAQTLCLNATTTALSVSASSPNGSAITYQWYSNASNSTVGGTAIGGASSASYTPPNNVAGTKYYYVICTNNQGSTTTNVSAAITIQSPSVGGTASSNQTICGGTSPANLTLASNTGSIQWQSSTDNITFTNIAGATSSTLTSAQMGVLNTTSYYRAIVTNGVCASTSSNTVTITVNPAPTFTSTTGASICGTGTATLQATTAAGTINWYAASTGGASLGTGTGYTTPSINTTTTYYTDVTNNGCTSNPRTAVLATVSAAPNPTITQTGCGTLSIGNLTGNALDLGANNNSSNYVTIPSTINSSFSTNNITLEGWFYFSATNAGLPMLIGEAYNVDANITYCIHRSGNQIIAGFYNGAWQAASSTTLIPINTWIHIASTYDQNQVKLYFNGVLNSTFNSNLALPVSASQPWYLGKRWDFLETLSGAMDEIRIWNVARTQAQIQASMNSSVPTNSAGLRAYYKLDESTGNIAADATGNGYNGTLSNSPTWQVPSTSPLNTNGNGNTFTYLWSPGGQTTSSITPVTSGTYSAVVTNAAGCQSASISSSIVVGVTASSNQTICAGTSPANLTLSGSTTTVQWQSSTDNITFTNIAGATSTTLSAAQMGTLNSTRYYRASYTNGACPSSVSTTVTITVTSSPTLTSTTGTSICGTSTLTLQATTAAGTINWYAASTGGASLGTGTSYTTPSIATTTTYYVDVTNNGCTSNPRTAVVASVNTIPTPTITQSGCGVLTLGNYGAGNALNLGTNNTSKYVSIPSSLNASFNTNNITVEGWFNLSVADPTLPEPMLVGEAYISDNKVTFMLSRYSNQIRAGFFSGTWTLATSASSIPANTWTHIAATYDQASIKIYINGVLDATLNTSTPIPTGNEVWYLGKRFAGADMISGLMDEVRIWNVARTQVQIQSSMNTNVPINSTGLRAYYQLDESTGTTASDATGNGYTGTLMNSPTWQVPSTSILGGPPATFLWSPGGQTTSSITPATSGTYSAVVTNAAGCQSASISSSIIIGVTASNNQTICAGTSPANLTLTGNTATIQWQSSTNNVNFTNIAGATSATLTTGQMGVLNTTTYYRANVTSTFCAPSTSNTVTISVNPTTFSSTTGASICGGPSTLTLQAATAAGTINWYAALTGGASLGTGTSYTTPSIATTTTYYAEVTNNGCTSSPRTAVVATVNAIPTLSSTTGASRCGTGTVTLQAATAAGTINWYAALTGGASLGTGTSFTTPSIAATTTYYAEVTNNGCTTNPRIAVVATVNTIPTLNSTTGASICGTGTATLQATTAAGTINWYAALTGGASLGTGTSYTTPSIATTTTYYVDVTDNGCTSSPRTAVVATVNSLPPLATNSPSGLTIDILTVAGGGGAGFARGGGGGAGGYIYSTNVSYAAGTSTAITVGTGGSPGSDNAGIGVHATSGTNSSFGSTYIAIGGGGGGSYGGGPQNGYTGGSGGGGANQSSAANTGYGGSGTAGQGNAGGNSRCGGGGEVSGGGGGGAGGNGTHGTSSGCGSSAYRPYNPGNGGNGLQNSISGSAVWYAGGGGGGGLGTSTNLQGTNGLGGGQASYGGGGQCKLISNNWATESGGPGIVIVRYAGTPAGTGGTITQVGGYTIHTFTANGTFAFSGVASSAIVPNMTSCGVGAVTFTGTVNAGYTLDWYDAANGGNLLSQGTSTYTTPALASTTTYYVAVRNVSTGCVSATRTAVVATIITGGTASSNQTVCPGLLPSAISLTNYSGTIQWQTSNNNVTFTNIASQTAATLAANSIGIMSGTKYIRAMVTNGACVTPSNVVTLSPANVNVLTPLTASSYVWNGQSSSDWGTLSNWYSYNGTSLVPAAALPGSTANTIIPANTGCILTQPTLSSGAIIINSLILETGSQLTQSGGTLLLYTNFVKNGSLISTGGLMNFYGPTSATISGSGAVQFAKMRVNKLAGATLTLQIPVSVADSLTMVLGNIYTTTNNLLTLGLNSASPGKLVYTNGTIVGPFKRFFANTAISGLAGRFPVGTATYNRYAQFNFGTTPGVDQSLTVQYVTGTPNQAGSPLYNGLPLIASGSLMQNYSADGYWSVLPTNDNYASPIASVNYDVTLFANNLTGMQTPQICRIIKSAGSNTAAQHHVAWQACGTHTAIAGGANPLAFLISSTASQGFSWFNIGTPNSQALPVEFAGMTTTCEEEAVSIRWTTESEHNNDYFRIEKSTNGSAWDILGYVDAVGNSSVLNGYEYLDLEFRSNTYYRLYQVDQDGSEEMLSTLYSDCDVATDEIASFPNPSHETFSIYWKQFNTSGDGTITIRDINGKTLHRETVELSLGANLFMIKAYLAPGVYMIELMDDDFERRLIKHVVK